MKCLKPTIINGKKYNCGWCKNCRKNKIKKKGKNKMSKVIRLNKETVDLLEEVKKEYMNELEKEWLYVLKNSEEDDEIARETLKKISFRIEDHKRYTESEWIYEALIALEKDVAD